MKIIGKRSTPLLLTLFLVISLFPGTAMAASSTVSVRIIGENSVILNQSIDVSTITDYTTDSNDTHSGLNALDAIISATQQNSLGDYNVSYNSTYNTYYISELAGVAPSSSDYWGTLAASSSGVYDGNSLSNHSLTAGDTYVVYYDKYTGGNVNYGYQSYAWFTADMASGTAGNPIEVGAKTTIYDESYNTVEATLSNATVYAEGGSYITPTAVAVTDSSGMAYITFADAGTYTLTLSSNYTYAQCVVTVSGSSVPLSDLNITVTDGTNNLSNASLRLTNSSGNICSAYLVSSSGYSYRVSDGVYNYYASANGYQPSNGTVTVSGSTTKDVALDVMNGYAVTVTPGDTTHETVQVKSGNTTQAAVSVVNGVYTYDLANGSYTFSVSRDSYHSLFGSFHVNGSEQNITPTALSHSAVSTAEWPSFRNDSSNMAIVSDSTPQGSWQAKENWTASLGALGSYGTLITSNIVIYDGYLYIATEHGLSKIDQSTGNVVTTTPLSGGASYVLQIVYGDGKIFVTNATGIDAFDALTMERVWSAAISSYGNYMATTPILYDDSTNTIYIGDYGDSNYTLGTYGGYSAINVSDGSSKWILYGGATDAHYWSGAVIVGNYLIFGSDSGTLTSVNKNTTDISAYGSLTATASILSVTGKIRSSIAYEGTYIYFTTNSGYIYKASIDDSTGKLTCVSSRQFASGSSSTPVVMNGRVYVGASDGIYVLNSDDLEQVSYYASDGAVQSSALLTTAYPGEVYAYFTVNSARGEIIALKDDGTNVSYDTVYTPSHAQYCTGSLVTDSSGTIYYSNDSGYLSAITNTNADNTKKAKVDFDVTPPSLFDSNSYTTTYPTITVEDNSGVEVTTAAVGTYYLSEGSYSYTVSLVGYTTLSGSFTIDANNISTGSKTIPVTLSEVSSGNTTSDITTMVSVLGYGGSSILNSTTITVQSGASVWDVIKKGLDDAGISYDAKDTSLGVYISSVNSLAEFDKGANSGWEYTVNGTKPSVGVSQYTLNSGDKIVLYYTADYTSESGSAAITPTSPANADLTATMNSSTGVASATLNGDALTAFTKTLASQSDVPGAKATINVSAPIGAVEAKLTIGQSAVSALRSKSDTSLCIETGVGSLMVDPIAIDSIGSAAGGSNVTFSISKLDSSTLNEANRALVASHPVYDLSIVASSGKITSFGKGLVNVSIPYIPKSGEDTSKLKVYYINSEGKAVEMSGAYYDTKSGCIIFATNHFSTFAVVYGTPKSFGDVAESDWYYEAVSFVSQYGVMSGTSDTSFEPDKNMSRAMLVTVLYRLAGEPAVNGTNNFTDVQDGQWYTDAVKWASANGIVSGYGGGLFGTNDSVTREQLATILYNYAKNKGCDMTKTADLKTFADASKVSSWAETALSWANGTGLIKGETSTTILPSGNATRAQAATILMRFYENYMN